MVLVKITVILILMQLMMYNFTAMRQNKAM